MTLKSELMKAEKTITICGKDVKMRYCLAAETGFESLANKEMSVFLPTPTLDKDKDGNIIYDKPMATTEDFLKLSIACILAAYEREDKEPPVSVSDILYDSTPDEVATMIASTYELRIKWYELPGVIKPETEKKEEANGKNA